MTATTRLKALSWRDGDLTDGAKRALPWAVVALGTLIRLPQLAHGLNEMFVWRQTAVASVALEYARHGIDLLHTPLPLFGPNSDLPFEFPLMQAAAALLIDAGLGPDAAVRVVGLLCFQVAAVLLTVLMVRWHGRVAAVVAVVLFEFSPYALAWGAAGLVDFPAVACSLGMVVGLDSWFRSGSRIGLIGGALSAWLAFCLKGTTAPAWCILVLVSAGTAYVTTRSWRRTSVGVVAGPILGLLMGSVWTRYADTVKGSNPLTEPMTTSALQEYNFGTLGQRLDPYQYDVMFGRIEGMIGPVVFGLLVAVVGIAFSRTGVERFRRAGWLATAMFGPLVFINLYYIHNYYAIAVFPAIVASVALGVTAISERAQADTAAVAAFGTVMVLVWSAATPQGRADVHQWLTFPGGNPIAKQIRDATQPDDLIVLVGCDFPDPELLYFADRRGLMFPGRYEGWDPHTAQARDIWSRENIDDYGYLFNCDPALDAYQHLYLPPGRSLVPTSVPGLSRIVNETRSDGPPAK